MTRRQFMRSAGAAGAGLFLPALLTACQGRDRPSDVSTESAPATSEAEIDELAFGAGWTISQLDMTKVYEVGAYAALALSLDGLLRYDDAGALQPSLATDWTNPDPLTYVYRIRDGATFWDGSPLTADDVVFSFARHKDQDWESINTWFFPEYESIEATAPDEVTFRLKEPFYYFRYMPAHSVGFIVQKDFAEAHIDEIGTPSAPTMGSGPYRLERFVADERVELVRNDDYWGDKPKVRRFSLRSFDDAETALLSMQAGEIHGYVGVPPRDVERWEALEGVDVVSYPGTTTLWATFDLRAEPYDDVHVRRALAQALDRPGLLEALYRGHATIAKTFPPPTQWGGLLSAEEVEAFYATLPENAFDLDAARAELAQSSVPDGFQTEVRVPADDEISQTIFQIWKEGAAEIGIDMRLTPVNVDELWDDVYGGEPFSIVLEQWIGDYPDPMNNLHFVVPSVFEVPEGDNFAHLDDPQIDSLWQEQLEASDSAARTEAVKSLIQAVADNLGYYFLFWPEETAAFDQRKVVVDGWSTWRIYQPWLTSVRAPAE